MTYSRITGNGLHILQCPFIGTACQGTFYSAMLITERYFQIQHILSVALKTKMSGFNYAGMYRAHGNLVYLVAIDPEKIHDRGDYLFVAISAPGIPVCDV
jgi:hypothetical protein